MSYVFKFIIMPEFGGKGYTIVKTSGEKREKYIKEELGTPCG